MTVYYHTILITFRPFLVADAVRCGRVQRENGQQISALHTALEGEEMWLRQACRYAVDAAQDQILFLCNKVHTIKSLKVRGSRITSSVTLLTPIENEVQLLLYRE